MQILGAEARSRVPEEFIGQQPTSANPPTLFLALAQMADQIAAAASDPSASQDLQEQEQFLKAGKPLHTSQHHLHHAVGQGRSCQPTSSMRRRQQPEQPNNQTQPETVSRLWMALWLASPAMHAIIVLLPREHNLCSGSDMRQTADGHTDRQTTRQVHSLSVGDGPLRPPCVASDLNWLKPCLCCQGLTPGLAPSQTGSETAALRCCGLLYS